MRLFAFGIVIAAAITLGAQPAHAQDDAYRTAVREALEEFEGGNFQEALTLFQQAHAIRPGGRVLRGIAKTLFELRQYVECLEAAEQALAATVDPLPRDLAAEVTALRDRAQRYVGTVVLRVEPESATLLLDGRAIEPAQRGIPIRVAMGSHRVDASAPEYRDTSRTVDVQGGGSVTETIQLEQVPVTERIVTQTVTQTVTVPGEDVSLLLAGSVIGGLGVAGVGVTLAWLIDRLSAANTCANPPTGAWCSNPGPVFDERDFSYIGIAGASALLVTGVVLVSVHFASSGGGEGESSPSATAACMPTVDGFACVGGGRW